MEKFETKTSTFTFARYQIKEMQPPLHSIIEIYPLELEEKILKS